MAKRPTRDPGAPKRNLSAYLLYQNAMREQFKALNPGMTFGQLAKYTSAMYAELPPTEKEAWGARAEADKARYLHELASYVPPPGFDSKGDAIISPLTTKSGRKGKPEKDVNAPKRNMSAYLLYQVSIVYTIPLWQCARTRIPYSHTHNYTITHSITHTHTSSLTPTERHERSIQKRESRHDLWTTRQVYIPHVPQLDT